jgi:membrane fusion protein, copper/silver efflux system
MTSFRYALFCFAVMMALLLASSRSQKSVAAGSSDAGTSQAEKAKESKNANNPPVPGTVEISASRQQTIGVKVAVVEKKPVIHTIRVLGRVEADETRIYRINAAVDGWITKVNYNTVGSLVKKGEVLATFTNPQFIDTEQSYLFGIDTVERLGLHKRQELGRQEAPTAAASDPFVLQRQMDALRGMGVGDDQLEEIGRTRKITLDIRITAPSDGFITARKVSLHERFLKGTELYQIADLRRVWILADVYEREVEWFKPGMKAKVTAPYKKRDYEATVTEVLPIFDDASRTLKVRLETDNPGYVLRSGMFMDVEMPVEMPPALTVPVDAILDSGLRKTVFVDRGNGFFEPREVETGWRHGNRVEITKGLEEGERIVISGNFLIDSESRLEMAAMGMQGLMSKDPVCGMDVSVNKATKAGRKSNYRGKTYYFISDENKAQFEKEPEKYVKE